MRATLLAVVVVLAALVSAAVAAGALSPSAYRAQANAICARFDRSEKAQHESSPGGVTRAFLEHVLARSIALNQQRYAAVDTLDPPASLGAAHRRVLAAIGRETALFQQVLSRVRTAPDPQRVMSGALPSELALYGRELQAWAATGAKTCANG